MVLSFWSSSSVFGHRFMVLSFWSSSSVFGHRFMVLSFWSSSSVLMEQSSWINWNKIGCCVLRFDLLVPVVLICMVVVSFAWFSLIGKSGFGCWPWGCACASFGLFLVLFVWKFFICAFSFGLLKIHTCIEVGRGASFISFSLDMALGLVTH
ncbi:hypothetical protein U1Q18_028611 [Sarracenia purpurea var. burkii]